MKKSFRLAAAVAAFGLALALASCGNSSGGSFYAIPPSGQSNGGNQTVTYPVNIPTTFENGTIASDVANPKAGDTVTLTATPADGYKIDTLTVKGADGSTITTSGEGNIRTFTMPAQGVTVSATFVEVPATTYQVTIPTNFEHGTISASPSNPREGVTVTLTAAPESGYKLGSLTVTCADSSTRTVTGTGNSRTFTMPAQNVTVSATFVTAIPSGFVKVAGMTLNQDVSGSLVLKKNVVISTIYACDHEVTQGEYRAIMGTNPSHFNNNPATGETQDNRPVEMVSWYDAITYCNKKSIADGRTPCYTVNGVDFTGTVIPPTTSDSNWNVATCDFAADGYRLPKEAEWEYMAREGSRLSTYTYSGSDTVGNVAWYSVNSENKTHEVKKKTANNIGLFDMSGNVYEWCWDTQGENTAMRIIRGGAYSVSTTDDSKNALKVSFQTQNNIYSPNHAWGFRVVCTAQ